MSGAWHRSLGRGMKSYPRVMRKLYLICPSITQGKLEISNYEERDSFLFRLFSSSSGQRPKIDGWTWIRAAIVGMVCIPILCIYANRYGRILFAQNPTFSESGLLGWSRANIFYEFEQTQVFVRQVINLTNLTRKRRSKKRNTPERTRVQIPTPLLRV